MSEHEKRRKLIDFDSELGMTRRDLLRRGAVVGGTLLWVAPAIQSIAPAASAQVDRASPGTHACCYCFNGGDPNNPGAPPPGQNPYECLANGVSGDKINGDACETYCNSLGYDNHIYQSGPDPFTCGSSVGGCQA